MISGNDIDVSECGLPPRLCPFAPNFSITCETAQIYKFLIF